VATLGRYACLRLVWLLGRWLDEEGWFDGREGVGVGPRRNVVSVCEAPSGNLQTFSNY
jgi:hypothetical protein